MARGQLDRDIPFANVARTFSTGIHAQEGGYWGFIYRDSLRERFQPAVDALFALQAGESSDVLEGPDAYFIVKCGAIDPGAEADFTQMQPELIESFRDEQFENEVDALVTKLREKATIEPDNLARFLRGVVEAAPQPTVRPAEGR
jgi:parvulin-like peptidyl-prolyl isomerase